MLHRICKWPHHPMQWIAQPDKWMGGWSQLCDNFIGDLKNDLDCVHHLELHNLLHRSCISHNIWIEKNANSFRKSSIRNIKIIIYGIQMAKETPCKLKKKHAYKTILMPIWLMIDENQIIHSLVGEQLQIDFLHCITF